AIAPEILRLWCETRNLIDLAQLTLKSAQFRTESRGGHYREDFPAVATSWQVHTLVQGDRLWRSAPVNSAPSNVV
ncbi:MAG: L-aspartate oxidase, partial [Cyanobacteria bacterium P01_D01_bin.71]